MLRHLLQLSPDLSLLLLLLRPDVDLCSLRATGLSRTPSSPGRSLCCWAYAAPPAASDPGSATAPITLPLRLLLLLLLLLLFHAV
jgi:hypothetical protein